jgi:hypothetical protein
MKKKSFSDAVRVTPMEYDSPRSSCVFVAACITVPLFQNVTPYRLNVIHESTLADVPMSRSFLYPSLFLTPPFFVKRTLKALERVQTFGLLTPGDRPSIPLEESSVEKLEPTKENGVGI